MGHKETWSANDLTNVGGFTQDLQDFIQEQQEGTGFRVKDILVVLEDAEKPRSRERDNWGLISIDNQADTTLQFEQGAFEIEPQ
jgi:hypothetical protein